MPNPRRAPGARPGSRRGHGLGPATGQAAQRRTGLDRPCVGGPGGQDRPLLGVRQARIAQHPRGMPEDVARATKASNGSTACVSGGGRHRTEALESRDGWTSYRSAACNPPRREQRQGSRHVDRDAPRGRIMRFRSAATGAAAGKVDPKPAQCLAAGAPVALIAMRPTRSGASAARGSVTVSTPFAERRLGLVLLHRHGEGDRPLETAVAALGIARALSVVSARFFSPFKVRTPSAMRISTSFSSRPGSSAETRSAPSASTSSTCGQRCRGSRGSARRRTR